MGNRYSASENSYRCLQQSTKRIINGFLCKLDGSLSPFRLIPNVVLFRCLTEIYFGLFVCDMEVSSDIDCRFQTTKKVNSCYPRGVHLVRLRQMHVRYDKHPPQDVFQLMGAPCTVGRCISCSLCNTMNRS